MNLHDDYSKISAFALEEKKNKMLDKWLQEKIPTYYVMVDNDAVATCPKLQKFNTDKKSF
jgi:peptidyl-prolyl cis-trans isomerase SurA